jgi:4-amino-4-deoxy-L-arabinose transferase-like glycosyltransferase
VRTPLTAAERTGIAWHGLLTLAGGLTALLLAVAGRYGYHRDELYFIRAGSEPAFGYADQPPLTPLLAVALDTVSPGSLVVLRTPSALAMGAVVVITGLIAREFGAPRGAQLLAAACIAVSGVVLVVGHVLSTTTIDLLVWTALGWLAVRGLRDGGPIWLAFGAGAGIGLQNKMLPAFLVAALLVGVLTAGPRAAPRSAWPWLGGLLALVLWLPYLVWQAANGFPQLALSAAIAAGSSGTSEPWYLILPLQLALTGPALVPVWALGWWRLARSAELRPWRAFAVAHVVLAALFLVTGGKPYYLAGMYPVLYAAGAAPVLAWAQAAAGRMRTVVLALAISLALQSVVLLPLLPEKWLAATPVTDIHYDAGETIGWPALAATVAGVSESVPDGERVAVLARNYGEVGAVDHFLPALGPAHSGHNAYWDWGPPPDTVTAVIVIGYPEERVRQWFGRVELAARVDNGVGVDNDEQGALIWVAREPRTPWPVLWPQLRRLG